MQIELGLIAAVAVIGTAVQLRILSVLQRKLKEIAAEQKKRDEEAEIQAADRFGLVLREKEVWEKEHSGRGKHARYESGVSSMPLMKDHDGSTSPLTPATDHLPSDLTLNDPRPRHHSSASEFLAAPTPEDELRRAARNPQTPGALPALDLGLGIQDDVPQSFMAKDLPSKDAVQDLEHFKRKEDLVAEIQTIRRSIDALMSETPAPSSSGGSRRPSLNSRRTLSIDATTALVPPQNHLRPPRERDPRARVRSMDMGNLAQTLGETISRPTSVPLQDDWDSYVQDRKLLQPPAGITPPIATASLSAPVASRPSISRAVTEALNERKRRESALGVGAVTGDPGTESSEEVPLAKVHRHQRSRSTGGNIPVTILPPRKAAAVVAPVPQRPVTRTFEELTERHREKIGEMQRPLTTAEEEHAELEAAKRRWERSKALEKEAVTKRQAEKVALHEKRKKVEQEQERSGRRGAGMDRGRNRNSRSLSADRLGQGPSKRLSTMKVEDWRKYQEEVERPNRHAGDVPFPQGNGQRRRSKDLLS